jgi:hypothetical protein
MDPVCVRLLLQLWRCQCPPVETGRRSPLIRAAWATLSSGGADARSAPGLSTRGLLARTEVLAASTRSPHRSWPACARPSRRGAGSCDPGPPVNLLSDSSQTIPDPPVSAAIHSVSACQNRIYRAPGRFPRSRVGRRILGRCDHCQWGRWIRPSPGSPRLMRAALPADGYRFAPVGNRRSQEPFKL